MTDAQSLAVKPASKALRIALAISVALNLAVAGVMAGAYLNHGGPAGRGGMCASWALVPLPRH